MPHKILIADPDEAFGQMLQQTLGLNGDYVTQAVTTGARALAVAQAMMPDLVIIDLAIADTTPRSLIEALRRLTPTLRVMLIPIGDRLPDEYQASGIQGVLTKPFFVGDLGATIAQVFGTEMRALVELPPPPARKDADAPTKPRVRQIIKPTTAEASSAPVSAANAAVAPVPSTPAMTMRESLRARRAASPPATDPPAAAMGIDQALAALAADVHADALLVMQNGALVAQRSNLPANRLDALIELLVRWSKVAGEAASLVGEPYGRFRQWHFEGDRNHIYVLEAAHGALLVVICRSDVSFGTIRLASKSALAEIAKHVR